MAGSAYVRDAFSFQIKVVNARLQSLRKRMINDYQVWQAASKQAKEACVRSQLMLFVVTAWRQRRIIRDWDNDGEVTLDDREAGRAHKWRHLWQFKRRPSAASASAAAAAAAVRCLRRQYCIWPAAITPTTQWATKSRQRNFCLYLRQKWTDFNAVFTLVFRNERRMCWFEFHPAYLIIAPTLPCESRNTENTYVHKSSL